LLRLLRHCVPRNDGMDSVFARPEAAAIFVFRERLLRHCVPRNDGMDSVFARPKAAAISVFREIPGSFKYAGTGASAFRALSLGEIHVAYSVAMSFDQHSTASVAQCIFAALTGNISGVDIAETCCLTD